MKKNTAAKCIRIVTVPPVMIIALLLILYFSRPEFFNGIGELLTLISLLGIVPVLAYPIQKLLPRYKDKGRDGQRALAFIFSVIGYVLALLWSFLSHSGREILLICLTYCLSVIILSLFNKVLHFKASGHACSQTGPIVFLIYFISWKVIFPGLILAALVVWSSLTLKRHTAMELLLGALVCLCAFALSMVVVFSFL